MMVLTDTSIWIRYLANRPPYAQELERLLEYDEVAGHHLVYGELLIGDRGGRRDLLASYERIYHVNNVSHREAVEFVITRNFYGRGVGWIDIQVLASALVGGVSLWTADSRLAAMAEELGIAYDFSSGAR